MKIEQEYLKSLLEAFETAENPYTDIMELKKHGYSYEEPRFLFHMNILHDEGFIERYGEKSGIGAELSMRRDVNWSVVPLRLTADGHTFIENLRNQTVWAKIKEKFKDAGAKTLWLVSKKLIEEYMEQQIGN